MAKKPTKKKRPKDVVGNAVHVMELATGQIEEEASKPKDGKNKAAQELGRKGGKARASKLTPEKRQEIARKAAKKRWQKSDGSDS
ncbi:RNA-binding protein [bacterium AH-315-P15]|nr:RNA-binding protein [bacterium AH-315-P15]